MPTLTYIEALSQGMWEEMERDGSVFLIGEDIGAYGGAFKATKGFQKHFGEERVIDSVLSEAAIIGAAAGAAVVGMRPIVEIQFADFVSCGFNQIITNCAKVHYRWNLPAPMVIRLPNGGYIRGGPYHSSSTEAWFHHFPGLKIVAPSTPADAKGLMKAAVRDNNPVLYLESKYLYRRIKGEVPEGDNVVEIGKADVKRNGSDIAIITYGSTVHQSLEAAEILAKEDGVEVMVLDLRTLAPLDKNAIFAAVKSTGKVLIVHEDNVTGGIGAEVAALIADNAFHYLDAPIKRLGALDVPVPFAPTLEDFVLPNTSRIVHELREMAAF
ncbi:MAG: alpha-ketoacid dehydrogenase subunit beta [Bacteroidetes bacterium]|nr:alpha-ketoacid dehydrogenase subunit beta [Bacteroidota bacterium]MCW5897189.1 alpha-ketoacid dehydrogenase subunit beta [Bacteroidota bacterium]